MAANPRLLTIVRPAIVESALHTPYPGWMESLKVADPILLGYGAGIIPGRFAANGSIRMDLIPVDFVANACLAAAGAPARRGHGPHDERLHGHAQAVDDRRHGRDHHALLPRPPDPGRGRPAGRRAGVAVLDPRRDHDGAQPRRRRCWRRAATLVDRLPIPRSDEVELRLHKDQRKLDRLRRLNEIYWPYGALDCVFDDRNARALLDQLHPDDRERFGFDVDEIDWDHYLGEVHLPALRAIAVPPAAGPKKTRSPRPPEGARRARPRWRSSTSRASCSTAPSRTSTPGCARATCPSWTSSCGPPASPPACPGWIMEDRRSRTAFNRNFYRLYKDLPARELKRQAKDALPDFIQPRIQHEAIRRIRQHKRRGDRVILVTGALDFLVESLEHLADELIAARLVERVGRFTGELAEPPLTADGRASLAARLAADHDVDLADCHAYGDSLGDLPLLELVGHPHAINPDFRLSREARRRRWPIEEWTRSERRLMKALTYTPTIAKYVATRAGPAGQRAEARGGPPAARARARLAAVRPRLTGICGSDLALLSGKASLQLATLTSTPFVPGHEIVGEIGAGPRRGERVVVQPALGCTVRGLPPVPRVRVRA